MAGIQTGNIGNNVSTFRRLLPQILAVVAKNLIIFNKGLFNGIPSLVIPSLLGISNELNPHETITITALQASWLSTLALICHPLGSVVSGPISDAIGRQKSMLFVTFPLLIAFIMLGFADSFPIICFCFLLLSFIFGLKDAPTTVYVSEICESSFRGTLLSIGPIANSSGHFFVYLLGTFLPWRSVSLACAGVPILTLIAICFVPESPKWLLSKDRPKDAQKSLQWLRGWVSPQAVHEEFTKLQNFSLTSNSCVTCAKQCIKCYHPKATFFDKIKELKRKRNMKPFILVLLLEFFMEFAMTTVWRPYMIQVIKAHGMPLGANIITVILTVIETIGRIVFLFSVKVIGKRKIYLGTNLVSVVCALGLSIYGSTFFPTGWSSFQNQTIPNKYNFEWIKETFGNVGYLALALLFIMHSCIVMGIGEIPHIVQAEVYPFKLRSVLCGLSTAIRYIYASVASKTYLEIETLMSLQGAVLFYGAISFIGLISMFYILPETEHKSLVDIELHYSDNRKGLTDIDIRTSDKNTDQ